MIVSDRSSVEGPVLVVGTGLIGTSIALALRTLNVDVWLSDPSPTALALASDMGAGIPLAQVDRDTDPQLVIVATPPDVLGTVVAQALSDYPEALVVDVASVKLAVFKDVEENVLASNSGSRSAEEALSRFVGSHPMSGRERSGASHAVGDLFHGRPWVIVPTKWSSDAAVLTARNLVSDLGAVPTILGAQEHDQAVALVSHIPQLFSSLLSARLVDAQEEALALAGQGLRDMTRIAGSDPGLWTAIVAGNAGPVAALLAQVQADLDNLLSKLAGPGAGEDLPVPPGAAGAISALVTAGNLGVARIPGKHGGSPRRWGSLEVLVPDEPGELGRLFGDLGAADINIEDLSLEHSARQPVGLARIQVDPSKLDLAEQELEKRGWRIAGKDIR